MSAASDGWTRVYTTRRVSSGSRAHLIDPMHSANSHDPAVCGMLPTNFGLGWFGTGSQVEYEIAVALPVCARCALNALDELRTPIDVD